MSTMKVIQPTHLTLQTHAVPRASSAPSVGPQLQRAGTIEPSRIEGPNEASALRLVSPFHPTGPSADPVFSRVPWTFAQAQVAQQTFYRAVRMQWLKQGEFDQEIAGLLAIGQFHYNLVFTTVMQKLTKLAEDHDPWLVRFIGDHESTEHGADLQTEHVQLAQSGKTHLEMITDMLVSMDIFEDRFNLDVATRQYFDGALIEGVGSHDINRALGSLLADEVLAEPWFKILYEGFTAYNQKNGTQIDLTFFREHANEVEAAHVKHVYELLDWLVQQRWYDPRAFAQGYDDFRRHLETWFERLDHFASTPSTVV